MLQKGTAKKVTIFVNEDTQHHFGSLCDSILTFLLHKGVSGATATRAMAGFGAHQAMHTTRIEVLTEHLPIRIEFIESAAKVDEIMPTLYDMVTDGVIEVQDTNVVKVANKERPSPPKGPHTETRGTARLMRIYMGESDKWQGEPLYEAILKRLFRLYGVTEIPAGIMPMTISWLGNSSVATLPTLLDLIQRGQIPDQSLPSGSIAVFASVGAGMNINSMVYRCA